MAERRMFAKTIVLSDDFLDMPMSARCLYFTLSMLADDDGFVNSPKSIMRQAGASNDDMNILLAKKYVFHFESGVVVIRHWRVNNYLRSDRYNETQCITEKKALTIEKNGAYSLSGIPNGIPNGIPTVSTGKDRLGKDRLGKDSKEKIYKKEKSAAKPKTQYAEFVFMTDEQHSKLVEKYGAALTARAIEILDNYKGSTGKRYKDDYRTILSWAMAEAQKRTNEESKRGNNIHSELEALYSEVDYEKSDS